MFGFILKEIVTQCTPIMVYAHTHTDVFRTFGTRVDWQRYRFGGGEYFVVLKPRS